MKVTYYSLYYLDNSVKKLNEGAAVDWDDLLLRYDLAQNSYKFPQCNGIFGGSIWFKYRLKHFKWAMNAGWKFRSLKKGVICTWHLVIFKRSYLRFSIYCKNKTEKPSQPKRMRKRQNANSIVNYKQKRRKVKEPLETLNNPKNTIFS